MVYGAMVKRKQPLEGMKHTEDKNQRATNETRKEGLKSYADMRIYAIGPAKLVPTMCHLLSPR